MTRNYIGLFLFILLITSALLIGVAGPRGLIVNNALQKQLATEQHQLDVQLLQLENLRKRVENVWSTDTLLDSARSIGYVQEGETVYYFFDEQGNALVDQNSVESIAQDANVIEVPKEFSVKGLSTTVNIIIASMFSLILVLFIAIKKKNKQQIIKFKTNESSDYEHRHQFE